jgi:ribulose-phosphate 3-epimerase
MVHVAPSILSADFARLGEQVRETEAAGAQRVHVDVMDGHFVPNLTMGPAVVASLRKVTRLPLEIHLMVEDPGKFVDPFIKAGSDRLIVHHEVLPDPRPLLRRIKAAGNTVGLAVQPDTPVEAIEPYLGEIDLALCMTVYAGFAGQAFLPQSPGRIAALKKLIDRVNPKCELEVDGGIDLEKGTAAAAVQAGANVLVAATAIFHYPGGAAEAVRQFRAKFAGQ